MTGQFRNAIVLLTAIALFVVLYAGTVRFAGPTIHLIGDSTMAERQEPVEINPERGWGQVLQGFFLPQVEIKNYAVNGRSSKSFIDEGRWTQVLESLQPGDFVLIQFGHNDQKFKDPTRYTNPTTGYYYNLKQFVDETRAYGATPVLLTSIVRRKFNDFGTLEDTHGLYPMIVRQLAHSEQVLFIDHLYHTERIVQSLGEEDSKKMYNWVPAGQYDRFPDGRKDDTHLSMEGAAVYAEIVAKELAELVPSLVQYLKLR